MGRECHRKDCMCSSWYLLKRLFGVKNNMEEAMFVSCLGFFFEQLWKEHTKWNKARQLSLLSDHYLHRSTHSSGTTVTEDINGRTLPPAIKHH